jgi:hypothetical protein
MLTPSISKDQPQSIDLNFTWWWVFRQAITAGVRAGMSFLLFVIIMDGLLAGRPIGHLRMIAAILLGRDALEPWYSGFAAVVIGLGIHLILSILFGLIFTYLTMQLTIRIASPVRRVAWGALFATGLWLVNYYLIAPVFGWYWFVQQTHWLVHGWIGHAVFFGMVLGWIRDRGAEENRTQVYRL